jgi:hypothetical protein
MDPSSEDEHACRGVAFRIVQLFKNSAGEYTKQDLLEGIQLSVLGS